jgi:hypothetical protein
MAIRDKVFPLGQIPRRLRNQFMRTRVGQRAMEPLGRELEPERWVFVIGCYNSGTTLLKDLLAQHPRIGALPGEGVKFTDALPRPEEFGWQRLWCRCVEKVRLEPGPQQEERVRRIKRQWSILYPRGRPNLLEKSIANAARTPFLQEHFQPAYFVYMVRNGYAVAEGIRRKSTPAKWHNPLYQDRYPIEVCAEQWRESDQLVEEDRPRLERFLQVYYEEFTANPSTTARRITDFLGLEPLPEELFGRRWKVHGVESAIRNMNGQSVARLSRGEVESIYRVAGERLEKHGYRRPELKGMG